MVTHCRGLRDCRDCPFRKHCGHAAEVVLRAHPPLLLDHPHHLVFRGHHAQQHIWVSLAGLQYRAQRGSSPPVFSLGVLISQDQRKIEVSLEGHLYHKSQVPAMPHLLEGTLYFASTPKNCGQVNRSWRLLAATSWCSMAWEAESNHHVGLAWLCICRDQGAVSLCSAGKPGKQMVRGEKREGSVKGKKKNSAAWILHLQTSRENMQKCVWLGEDENKPSSCISLHSRPRE